MDNKILIGGAVIAVGVVVFIAVKLRSAQSTEETAASAPQMMPDSGYFSALAPSSGGITSGDYGASGGFGGLPSMPDESNSGSSDQGGGFDLASLFAAMFKGQQENDKLAITSSAATNQYAIASGSYNYDSSVLASIVGANGTAQVKHENGGTIITNTPGADPYQAIINDIYKTHLGRAPDLAGGTFWKNQLMNKSESITSIVNSITLSDEYKRKNAPPVTVKYVPYEDYVPPVVTSNTTVNEQGQAVVTQTKRQA